MNSDQLKRGAIQISHPLEFMIFVTKATVLLDILAHSRVQAILDIEKSRRILGAEYESTFLRRFQ